MTQKEILEIIRDSPGVKQIELIKLSGLSKHAVWKQVRQLKRWNLIRREKLQKGLSGTYKLYSMEENE